jgi:hypothetical protein
MERELWPLLYRLLLSTAKDFHQKNVTFQPWILAAVLLWAALHDRPPSWACDQRHWSTTRLQPVELPSPSTISRRLYTVATGLFLHALEQRIRDSGEPRLVAFLDGKPLPVGGASKDPEAKRGRSVGGMAKGYKLHAVWSDRPMPEAWEVTPLNVHELVVAERLLEQLSGGGYLLADGNYDSSPLADLAYQQGYQLVTPLPDNAGQGHRYQSVHRLRNRDLLAGVFGKELYSLRAKIERSFGNATSFAAGLGALPAWGETSASGSHLGMGKAPDQRCPDREKTRTYVINAKGCGAPGLSACLALPFLHRQLVTHRLLIVAHQQVTAGQGGIAPRLAFQGR